MSQVTKKQLEEKIRIDRLSNNKDIFYSLAKKHGNMLGSTLGGHNVLLIFSPAENELFYALDDLRVPFVHESDIKKKPKKDTVNIQKAEIINPPKTVQLHIRYSKSDQKGSQAPCEWKFDLVNVGMAQNWFELLSSHKKSATSQKQNTGNASLGNLDPKKEEDPITFLMTDSKILINKQENPSGKNNGSTNTNQPVNPIPPASTNNTGKNQNQEVKPEQSRLRDAYELTSLTLKQSRIKPQNQNSLQSDWNFRFVKDPTREIVYQYQEAAFDAFLGALRQMKKNGQSTFKNEFRGLFIEIVDCITQESKKLKNQYRNYHYILDCCKGEAILSVPLTCLIEHLGFVALVKAKLPKQVLKIKNKKEVEQVISELQHRTKISNMVLFNNKSSFYDLTKIYGSYGEASRIYVDDLDEYMPQFNLKQKEKDEDTFYVRPNLMQYFQNRVMPGGNIEALKNSKLQGQFSAALQAQITDISEVLSSQEIYIMNIFDLKQFLHFRGVNMKFLHKIYQETKNKFVKKYLQTCIVAKIIKDEISIEINEIMKESRQANIEEFVEEQIRFFIQGKTATTNEYWKKISLKYRSMYGQSLNAHELVGGFLLSCLMTLITADYDLSKINKEKTIFKDQGIILKGFVKRMKPKIKSYYRFSSKIVETVEICKYTEQNQDIFRKLVTYMNLNQKNIPQSYNVNNSRPYILGYLSDFVPPDRVDQQTLPCSREIYDLLNYEPPSAPTLKITLNYFNSYLKYLRQSKNKINEQCEAKLQNSIQIINYWLEIQHPKICQFYEKASNYQDNCGNADKSLRILEEAINIAYKTEGKNTKKIGMRHYVAGCQYLKSGKKKEAIQNLQKAKTCLQKAEGLESEHALTLLKLSSLQLNNGDTDSCIKYGKQALKNAQKGKMKDEYTIKIYEILCRAFEIKGEKQELKKLSLICSKQFNRTEVKLAFSQMVKICLTGTLAKLNIDRSKSLVALVHQLKQKNAIKDDQQSLNGLMERARGTTVMENFMARSENVEKYLSQYLSKKELSAEASQFITTLCLVSGVVGVDFLEGLHDQKQFE